MTHSASCYHCSLPLNGKNNFQLVIKDVKQYFCCPGCLAICQLISSSSLHDYYQNREVPAITPKPISPREQAELESYRQPYVLQQYIRTHALGGKHCDEITLSIEGISCAACLWLIEKHINHIEGVYQIQVNLSTHRAILRWNNNQINLADILYAFRAIGYPAKPYAFTQAQAQATEQARDALKRLAVSGLGTMQVMMFSVGLYAGDLMGMAQHHRWFLQLVSLLVTLPVLCYSARPFFRRAILGLRQRHFSMEVPSCLAIVIAFFASVRSFYWHDGDVYFDSVCMFIFFLGISQYLQLRVRLKSQTHMHELQQLVPTVACKIVSTDAGEEIQTEPTHSIKLGDKLLVNAGESIPVDAKIISGETQVDESMLTGESAPISKAMNDIVYAGSINLDASIHVQASRTLNQSVAAKISHLIEQSLAVKPQGSRLTEYVAKYFTFAILLVACFVYGYWSIYVPAAALKITLSVLIITCPCALSLAAPTAMTMATHVLAKLGFVISQPHVLTTLPTCKRIIFDKTGTLTLGEFEISDIKTNSASVEYPLEIAALLESQSTHPLAKPFKKSMFSKDLKVEVIAGKGLTAVIENIEYRLGQYDFVFEKESYCELEIAKTASTVIYLSGSDGLQAVFTLADSINPTAKLTLQNCSNLGLMIELISGDGPENVAAVADELAINHYKSRALPSTKIAAIAEYQRKQQQVIMVGDGVNDAPALAAADVGICMAKGTDISKATSDVYLMHQNLNIIPQAIVAANKTKQTINQNLLWAVLYNLTALPLAVAGMVPPYLAALGMSASSLLVVLNSVYLARKIVKEKV